MFKQHILVLCWVIGCSLGGFFLGPTWAGLNQTEAQSPSEQIYEQTELTPNTDSSPASTSPEAAESGAASEPPTTLLAAEDAMPTATPPKDIILVLDNSGSMKNNDPQFLAKQAVTEFIGKLDQLTRIAIVIFAQDVHMELPLTDVLPETKTSILQSLDQIDYKGLLTNIPAAIERAIYDLKNDGREEARKAIIFITDGLVDTGDADRDLEKTKWLKNDLAADAADAEIRIFGIAFTENADFELIQSLAQNTKGEYYRVLKAEDLSKTFAKLNALIDELLEPEPPATPTVIEKIIAPAPAPEPIIVEVPVAPPVVEEQKSYLLLIFVILLLSVLVVVGVFILLRINKRRPSQQEAAIEAFLNDLRGVTEKTSYPLQNKPTMLGRVAGKDTDNLNYIVIPDTAIGRRHALIEYQDFSYWVIDQGSINGTFVNDKVVASKVRLKHGDRVKLYKTEFEFVMPEMVDEGRTVILGGESVASSEDATLMPDALGPDVESTVVSDADLDFEITMDKPIDTEEGRRAETASDGETNDEDPLDLDGDEPTTNQPN